MNMVKEIKVFPDPVLYGENSNIDRITEAVRELARDMTDTMYEKGGIGLAAPQVGENCQLVTVDVSGPQRREELLVMVNPEIIEAKGEVESEEGCLSLPDFKGTVRRAEEVTVSWRDLDGGIRQMQASGLLACCLQHEIDHLRGVLLVDQVGRLKRNMYVKKMKKLGQGE
jgi:peptide deformylase